MMAMAITGTMATAQPNITARAQTAEPVHAEADAKPRHVLCVPQKPKNRPVVRMHHSTRTRWQLLEPVVSYEFGNADYTDSLDPQQRKRLSIQPVVGASPTSLVVETSTPQTFRLVPVDDAADAVELVLIRPIDPVTGEMVPDPRCSVPDDDQAEDPDDGTIERMEQAFESWPAKSGRWSSDGFALEVRLSEQFREGDTMKCRYTLDNQGLHYQVSTAQIIPLGMRQPVENMTISVDGRQFPVELPHGARISGSIHVKAGASLLTNGFKLQLIPSRLGLPAAPVGFKDPEPNEGRLSLQAHAVGGAISLKSTTDPSQTDFTTAVGGGGRLVYGFNKNVSVDVALAVLATQQAEFDDNSTAKATTVRTLVGGVLHFGETTVPYLRVGIGARLSSYTESTEDGSTLRGSLLGHLGGGIDYWVGDSFVMGVSAQYVGNIGGDDESYSLELGAHAGFAWKP